MVNVAPAAAAPPRVPVPVLLAALFSLGTLLVTAHNGLPLVWVFVLVILASYLSHARIPDGSRVHLPVFVLSCLVMYTATPREASGQAAYDSIGPAQFRNVIAQAYAIEMAIQFWRWRNKSGDAQQSPLLILLLSGLVFLSASNTFDDRFIRYLAPPYLLFVAISLFLTRSRSVASGSPRRFSLPLVLRVCALLVAFGMGGAMFQATTLYRGNLIDFANRMAGFAPQPPRMEATAMASQPQLGPMFGLRGTPVRVLRINNYSGDPHWHGVAFDNYKGGTWGPSVRERRPSPVEDRALQPPAAQSLGGTETVLVSRLVSDNPLVYFPLETAELDKGDASTLSGDLLSGGPLRTPRRTPSPYDYTVTLAPSETYQGIWAVRLDTAHRDRALALPDDLNPGINTLAQSIAGNEKTDKKKAGAIIAYLLTHHPYSLNFIPDAGKYPDPLADFLLSEPTKGAHCEFFATAAAVMLRCVGVPTRYVTGYFAHEGIGANTTVVRQRDAHAWCEAWITNVGWVVVEATPASGRPDGVNEPVEPWRKGAEWLQDRLRDVSDFVANLTTAQTNAAVGGVVGLSLAYGGWLYVAQRRRKRAGNQSANPWAYSQANPSMADLAARFEAVWAQKTGSPIPSERPYNEYLAEVPPPQAQTEVLLPIARLWVKEYDRARFGGGASEADLANLRDLLNQMEKIPTSE